VIDGENDKPDMSRLNIYIRNRKFVNKNKNLFAGLEVETECDFPENREIIKKCRPNFSTTWRYVQPGKLSNLLLEAIPNGSNHSLQKTN